MRGHAIEVRLYAEEPAHDWRPSTGTLHRFEVPHTVQFGAMSGDQAAVRLDSAVTHGSVVSPYYDPMLAKVIAWAPTRHGGGTCARDARCTRAELHGVATNRDLLVRVLRGRRVRRGRHRHRLPRPPPGGVRTTGRRQATNSAWPAWPPRSPARQRDRSTAPWRALPSGWRNVVSGPQVVTFEALWGRVEVGYRLDRTGGLAEWSIDGEPGPRSDTGTARRRGGRVWTPVCVVGSVSAPSIGFPMWTVRPARSH